MPCLVDAFRKKRNLKSLGMPHFIGHGSHDLNGKKHRFIVMPRFGTDVWSLYLDNGRTMPLHTVYRLAIQMVWTEQHISIIVFIDLNLTFFIWIQSSIDSWMFTSTFMNAHMCMPTWRQRICFSVLEKTADSKYIWLILVWHRIIQQKISNRTQRKCTTAPLNTRHAMHIR